MPTGDDFRFVKAGDPVKIPANWYNTVTQMMRWWRSRQQNLNNGYGGETFVPDVILIKNNSGSDVGMFGVLGIDSTPIIDPSLNLKEFKSAVILKGVSPATGTHEGKFAITTGPIKNGSIGEAVISGTIPCQVDITASGDQWAEIKNTTLDRLKSGGNGSARILYAQSGTGLKWCIVRMCEKPNGYFPVIVKQNGGSAGSRTTACTFAYDLYDISDVSLTTKLNTGSALQPKFPGPRAALAKIKKADDGSPGQAYRDATGAIRLYSCCETYDGQNNC